MVGLSAYLYPPMALLHRAIQKIWQCNCKSSRLARHTLVLGPCAAVNRDPTSVTCVNNTSQTVPQPSISQQSKTSQPPCLVSRSGQLQEQGFSVEVAEIIAAPQRSSTMTIYKSTFLLYLMSSQTPFEPMKDTDITHLTQICFLPSSVLQQALQ